MKESINTSCCNFIKFLHSRLQSLQGGINFESMFAKFEKKKKEIGRTLPGRGSGRVNPATRPGRVRVEMSDPFVKMGRVRVDPFRYGSGQVRPEPGGLTRIDTPKYRINYQDRFSPVAKFTTIKALITIALSKQWPIHQLDVVNAFLHGDLDEEVYIKQPKGFEDTINPNYVCKLHKALYGLRQASRQLFKTFSTHLKSLGFKNGIADTSLFVFQQNQVEIYMVIYVDDILLTGNDSTMIA
ncbi:hypothetical protein KFK09_022929 [Dendrobium nobile]|uniref:Reverse transcriptase Ty1/copia-type domain-containing protein n=1 Tax=Dendrobium nobile TaxID=94219 RepID=A0A8T3AJM1_DENNO|nr:hypothetical protein KFK09_022929 [Dendrobium nobile]